MYERGCRMRISAVIEADTIEEAHPKVLDLIHNEGSEHSDEYGAKTREVFNLMITLKNPTENMIPHAFHMTKMELEDYALQYYLSPKVEGEVYTYGERMLDFTGDGKHNQIQYVIDKLKKNPNSRRAVVVLWDPVRDGTKIEHPPCMDMLTFNLREGKLHCIAVFRSNDMLRAWPANAFGITRLTEFIAGEIGCEIGTITTLSISAHIYL